MSSLPNGSRWLGAVLSLAAATGCQSPPAAPAEAPSGAGSAAPEAAGSGAKRGIDKDALDPLVAPGDDFFLHANGGWLQRTEIPPDRSRWGVAAELMQKTERDLHALLEAALASTPSPGSGALEVADYYASLMDEAAIEAQGVAPLGPALERIAGLKTKADLARELGASLRADVDPLNNTDLDTDRLF